MKALSFSVVIYMIIALGWWSILLNRKNTEAFEAQRAVIELQNEQVYGVKDYDVSNEADYIKLKAKYIQQQYMIFGEALVFVIVLIIGIWLINRAYLRELATGKRQQNFLLSITHELKTPLASISLIFDTIRRRQLSKEQLDSLSVTGRDDTQRLEKLINNLLMAAKIDTEQVYNLEQTDITELSEQIVEKYSLTYNDVTIKADLPDTATAYVDREAFVIVVTNLIENAIKYRDPNRKLQITLTIRCLESHVELSVADNGIGISSKERKHIFDKFYRIGAEETRTTKGTGLGLFIVKKIIERHQGSISVENNEPQGSQFVTTWKANA